MSLYDLIWKSQSNIQFPQARPHSLAGRLVAEGGCLSLTIQQLKWNYFSLSVRSIRDTSPTWWQIHSHKWWQSLAQRIPRSESRAEQSGILNPKERECKKNIPFSLSHCAEVSKIPGSVASWASYFGKRRSCGTSAVRTEWCCYVVPCCVAVKCNKKLIFS